MTTKLIGTKVQRVEDQRFLRGQGRYVDDVAVDAGALHAAVLRSPHAHARIVDIDVDDGARPRGRARRLDLRRPRPGAMAEPLPLLIPHPALTHGRTQYALAKDEVNYVGEAIAFVVADDRYVAEDARRPDPGRLRVPPAGGRHRRPPGPRRTSCTTTCPATSAPGMEQENGDARAAIAAAPHTLTLDLDRRAQRLHADGGPRHRRPLGPRHQPAAGVDLDPDLDRRPRRASPPSSASTSARST